MYAVCAFILVLGLSVGSINAEDSLAYQLFEAYINLQVTTASKILNVTKDTLQALSANTNEDFIKVINTTFSNAYDADVKKYNVSGVDQSCIDDAKYSRDNLISDSIDEVTSCQNLTQASEKLAVMDGTSGLEQKLISTSQKILADALKCKQSDFSSQYSCMQRKADNSDPKLSTISQEITDNLHKIGGLSLLVHIEYIQCQSEEKTKLADRVSELEDVIKQCVA